MNILMYKGTFQYGVVDLFIDEVHKGLIEKGNNVIIIDLVKDSNVMNKIIDTFSNKIIDFVIGFGGIGFDIKLKTGQSIYDAVNTTYLAIYVDHPAHLISRVIEPIRNHIVSFIDKEHVNYVNEIQQQNHKISFFLPHGGLSKNEKAIETIEEYKKQKDIDIVFSGSFMGEVLKTWENDNSFPNDLIDKVCEKLIYDDYASVHKTFYEVFEEEGITFSQIAKAQLSKLFVQIITYVRQYKRKKLIEEIVNSNLNIVICGKNWDDFVKKYKNIKYLGALDVNDTLDLIQRSKVLINATPNFTNGSHERVFTGMLNQTIVFTDKSIYYDKFFKNEEEILYYSFNTLDRDMLKLKDILADDKKLFEISNKAYAIAKEKHTWENRVEEILRIINLSKSLDK